MLTLLTLLLRPLLPLGLPPATAAMAINVHGFQSAILAPLLQLMPLIIVISPVLERFVMTVLLLLPPPGHAVHALVPLVRSRRTAVVMAARPHVVVFFVGLS